MAVEDAGFGAVDIRIKASGSMTEHEGRMALRLPAPPERLMLIGGERIDELEAAQLPVDSRVELRGRLHPAGEDQLAAMEVDEWDELAEP